MSSVETSFGKHTQVLLIKGTSLIEHTFTAYADIRTMADQEYEYRVEPAFLSPTELRNEQYKLEDLLNELAEDGWVYEDVAVVDPSSLLFFFRRPVEPE
jgi:hypothetical protein